jgi:hypothetical protein
MDELLTEGCDHNCKQCELWLETEQMCFNEWHKKWKRWNEVEHIRFGKILKGNEDVSK